MRKILTATALLFPLLLSAADKFPPYVLVGSGKLICNISSTKNGIQTLTVSRGSGITFDIDVTPILDGVLSLKKQQGEGMNYRFTSNLAKAKSFSATGFGPVTLLEISTHVSINTRKFRQPKGPGTEVSFTSNDMDRKGMYVEFRGKFRQNDTGKKFAFRTILGPPTSSDGKITPQDSNDDTRIIAKMVVVELDKGDPFSQIITTIQEAD